MESNEEKREIDLSSLLTSLLSNSDALSKMGDTIAKYTNGDNSPPNNNNSDNIENANATNDDISDKSESTFPTFLQSENNPMATKLPELLSLLSSKSSSNNPASKQQIALLLAIKPYLSNRRQELIDSFIKISQFSEILKKIT